MDTNGPPTAAQLKLLPSRRLQTPGWIVCWIAYGVLRIETTFLSFTDVARGRQSLKVLLQTRCTWSRRYMYYYSMSQYVAVRGKYSRPPVFPSGSVVLISDLTLVLL